MGCLAGWLRVEWMPYFMERVRARANFKGFVYRVPALVAANLALRRQPKGGDEDQPLWP